MWRRRGAGAGAGGEVPGCADGTGGDDYVHFFTVDRSANATPVADPQAVNVNEEGSALITLTGSDADLDALTFGITGNPLHGVLSGFDPVTRQVIYTPDPDYNGSDSFTFQVDDGKTGIDAAVVSITVDPLNDAPVANAQSVTANQNTAQLIVLTGNDIETPESGLVFTVVDAPLHGTLTPTGANSWTYDPDLDYLGEAGPQPPPRLPEWNRIRRRTVHRPPTC